MGRAQDGVQRGGRPDTPAHVEQVGRDHGAAGFVGAHLEPVEGSGEPQSGAQSGAQPASQPTSQTAFQPIALEVKVGSLDAFGRRLSNVVEAG